MHVTICNRIATTFVILQCVIVICGSLSDAQELKVLYRNGTELSAALQDKTIDWVTVSKSGNLIDREIKLGEIKSLTLSRNKSSELLATARRNIRQLGDADYLVREQAESALANSGGPFKGLLKQMLDSPSMEVRHRAGRLLEGFSKRVFPPLSMDTLVLINGRTLEGEAREFSLSGEYRGEKISLDRKRVAKLFKPRTTASEPEEFAGDMDPTPDRVPVKTEIFHKHVDFDDPNQTEFKFETDANGEPFRDRARIDSAFASDGLLFRNEQSGYVGVSVFSFKYAGLPVGGRSVCLYGQDRSRRQFQGVMEIRFCVAGKPTLPAGVKEVGLFIARVKHSRDIVMEAYNAQGNVLATVEATDQQCVFAGVKSNELITRLRIFSSPWLENLSRKVDVDFAIDSLRMSVPIAVQSVAGLPRQRPRVVLANGDRFSTGSINTTGEGDLFAYVSGIANRSVKFTTSQDELASVHLYSTPPARISGWKAMLEDGSIVNVVPGKTMKSDLLGDKFSMDDIVGLWKGSAPARYPIDGDWKSGQALVVFPTCRIQSDPFSLGQRSVSWKINKKIQQQLMLGREDPNAEENQEDPTPWKTSFAFSDQKSVQLPTFWNRQPLTNPADGNNGVVELNDGQRFLFGVGKLFQLVGLKNREVRLTWMDSNPVNIALKNVRTIIFPER